LEIYQVRFLQFITLPSTSVSAEYHSPRCYFKIQTWVGRNGLCAEDWEWVKHDGVLYPKITRLPPAQDNILKILKCAYKGNCSSMSCTCKKNNLECSVACSGCKGISWTKRGLCRNTRRH
jgi:hypothetical protein